MVLKLVGNPLSTCTRRVAVVLKEKKVPFEIVTIDLAKGEHKGPEFLAKQPFGQVPYLDDDGFILFESRAIGRYIATKYHNQGTPLIPDPSDLKATALLEQAACIEQANFDPFASGIAYERVFKPMRGGKADEEHVKSLFATLNAKLDAYDVILGKQKYLAGDNVTVVDLFHLPYGAMLGMVGFDVLEDSKRPNVVRWWKDITSRESWQTVKDRADA